MGSGTQSLLITLMVGHVVASLAVAEIRRLRSAILALVVQSALLAAIIGAVGYLADNSSLYLWVVVCVLTKVLLVPLILWRYCERLPEQEQEPIVGFHVSVVLLSIALVALYHIVRRHADIVMPFVGEDTARAAVAMAFVVIALGLYIATVRRSTIKMVLGLIVMENGVHLTLLSLAPSEPTTALVGVASNVIVLAWVMLYIAAGAYEVLGTTDVTELSELKR